MRKSLLSVAATLALLAASSAHAQVYLGGNVGWARIGADCDGASSCDKTSTGYKGYLGYRWSNNIAVEALYVDWGKATAQERGGEYTPPDTEQPTALRRSASETAPINNTIDYQLRATSWGVGIAYFVPFAQQFSGVARVGVVQSRGKLSGSDGMVSDYSSKNSVQPYGGIGVAYHVTPMFAITAEGDFSRVKYGADGDYNTATVQLWSVGAVVQF